MTSSIHEFVDRIPDFDSFSKSEMIDYFTFYLTEIEGHEGAVAKDIERCFNELKVLKYSNIASYLSKNSKRNRGKDS